MVMSISMGCMWCGGAKGYPLSRWLGEDIGNPEVGGALFNGALYQEM
jgi:hypothetical protein